MKESQFEEILKEKWSTRDDFYAPLSLENITLEMTLPAPSTPTVDVSFVIAWLEKRIQFIGEFKSTATPRTVRAPIEQIETIARKVSPDLQPALIVPYLSSGIVTQLEGTTVSGFDLNGNYIVQTPQMVALRLDQPNEYPTSRDIKKVYTYNSSIVGRFLLRENRKFEQVNEINEGIQQLGGGISLSTVSKVLKGLADDLIIEKRRGCIRVLQATELMQRLIDGYRPPRIDGEWKLNLPGGDMASQREFLEKTPDFNGWLWSGATSAPAYATTTPPGVRTVYTPRRLPTSNPLSEYEDNRFYNVVLQQTEDAYAYFDRREYLASPIESCLALAQLDKRERQVAREIEASILEKFNGNY